MQENIKKPAHVTKNSIGRLVFAGLSILLELLLMILIITRLNDYAEWISLGTRLFSFILVMVIYCQHKTATMKMSWIILILIFPILGITMYLLVGFSGTTIRMRERFRRIDRRLSYHIPQDQEAMKAAAAFDPSLASLSGYLNKYAGYPLYNSGNITFFPDSWKALEAQKEALRSARSFIFMEYFAIEDAESWIAIEEILKEKIAQGVEVRMFYDDMGSISFLNKDFVRNMQKLGIQCRIFNPIVPLFNLFLNNRDHRKITVVDGRVGFTGGYNLANEYFNITMPYGLWKDAGVRIEGPAVSNLTAMFLEMWNAIKASDEDDASFEKYFPKAESSVLDEPASSEDTGKKTAVPFIQPFGDIPMDSEQVGENTYFSLIESASDYIYFMTPYLILTDEITHALGLAAKRGVDVRIITPGIPDKKLVYSVSRSYYYGLVRNGVRIFEYTPGFSHAKMCVLDDKAAVCGTINLDYRSLYHHFEDAVLYYNTSAVTDMRDDFLKTFPLCKEVTKDYGTNRPIYLRIGQLFLRLFAPLL